MSLCWRHIVYRDHVSASPTATVCRSNRCLSSRTVLNKRVTCAVLLCCCSFRFPDLFPDTAGVELMQKKLNALIQDGVVGLARLKKNEPSVVDPARSKLASTSSSQDDDQLTDRERRQAAEKILLEQKDNVVFENNGNGGGGGGGGENSEMTADVRLESRCV